MTAIDRGTGRGIDRADLVAVVGTGTMGQGIAQVALAAGHPVRLYDAAPGRASRAADAIADRLGRLVAKERLTAADRDAALGRLTPIADLADLAEAELVVEAILEELDAKRELFTALESVVSGGCLLATNTSSLSVTAVAGVLRRPGRLLGLHFFNPAPLMPLVEVVRGAATDETAVDRAHATVAAWGKTPVRCADTPGFIVNRIARPFYAEAFRAYEERAADPATLDAVLRGSGGFRMGPFELTDLIGQDVNEAVTRSVWEALFHDPKFTPSLAQRQLVASGRHGRKTGHGWYDHSEGAGRPAPHTAEPCEPPGKVALHGDLGPAQGLVGLIEEAGIPVTREPVGVHLALPDGTRLSLADGTTATDDPFAASVRFDLALDYRTATRVALAASMAAPEESLRSAIGLFQALGKEVSVVQDVPGMVVARTVAMLVDFAEDAAARGVASPEDIDTAMLTGVNYPRGPLAWGRALGARWVRDTLRNLHQTCPTGRYAPSQALIRRAAADERLL